MSKIDLRELLRKSDSVILDALDGKCATCENYSMEYGDINGEKQGAHCRYYGVTRFDDSCSKYGRTYNKGNLIDGLERIKRKSFFIVTTVCNILGLPEDNEYRDLFAEVIEEYLMGTKDGEDLLAEYDAYGIDVAINLEALYESEERLGGNSNAVKEIIEYEILPEFDKMVKNVKEGNVKRAIIRYIVLTRRLMERFNIKYQPIKSDYKCTEHSIVNDTLLAYRKTSR